MNEFPSLLSLLRSCCPHKTSQRRRRRRLGLALVLVEVMARPRSVTRYHMGWCCSGKIWEDGSGWMVDHSGSMDLFLEDLRTRWPPQALDGTSPESPMPE